MILVSAFFLWFSFGYEIGTSRRMGPGYFPLVVSSLGVLIGIALIASGLRFEAPLPRVAWRPALTVSAGLIAFGLTVTSLGLLPATVLLIAISAVGNPENRLGAVLGLAVAGTVLAWLIFIVGLSVPVPSFAGVLSWI
ncbi:tripartite tricarboxylate transporter TctB family protein [Ancylobacter sp. A5.8]|uniref:tripartite tricarboxylate transporter TctB family protein n=1 Tax=Ancylobacter gelatini TaxID=2919920 RepID=UPI001F4D7D3E|nr:tripartite tricarboxylate transporter TctB family protein [Ancylobacter gelatini]